MRERNYFHNERKQCLFILCSRYILSPLLKAQELLSSNKIGKIIEALQILQVRLKVGIQIQNFIIRGGPLFDMGYYLTALVKALGPVQEVIGYSKTFDKRNVENPEVNYKEINVDVDTHYFGLLNSSQELLLIFKLLLIYGNHMIKIRNIW